VRYRLVVSAISRDRFSCSDAFSSSVTVVGVWGTLRPPNGSAAQPRAARESTTVTPQPRRAARRSAAAC